jgi:ABC-type Fe3+/spermidine/putrescine transport system ATPase subunit
MGLVNLVPAKVTGIEGRLGLVEAAGGLKLEISLPPEIRVGDSIEVAIRPENIILRAEEGSRAKISDRTFLGNISEYYASLDSGLTLRVQTHPAQVFAIGEQVALKIDETQCSVFRSNS